MTFTTLLIKMKAVASYPGPSISITCGGSIACVSMILFMKGLFFGRGGGGGVVRPTRPTPGYGPARTHFAHALSMLLQLPVRAIVSMRLQALYMYINSFTRAAIS